MTWDSSNPGYIIYSVSTPTPPTPPTPNPPSGGACVGSISSPIPFYVPSVGQPTDIIQHVKTPYTNNGFTIDVGKERGTLEFANTTWLRELDKQAAPFKAGTVDTKWGLPNSTTDGWTWRTTSLHENWNEGLSPDRFGVLLQKMSKQENVAIVKALAPHVGHA